MTVAPCDRSGEAVLVLSASPNGGWAERADALRDLHGFFDGDERWGRTDTVIAGSDALGAGIRMVVAAPGLDRHVVVEIPAGHVDLALDVDL